MFKDMEMTKQNEIIQTYKIFGRCYEKMCKNKRVRQIFEMGSENADNTIEENDKWKVGSKTYLALLLYSFHDPKQHDKADKLWAWFSWSWLVQPYGFVFTHFGDQQEIRSLLYVIRKCVRNSHSQQVRTYLHFSYLRFQ